jgi:hypothetical protein
MDTEVLSQQFSIPDLTLCVPSSADSFQTCLASRSLPGFQSIWAINRTGTDKHKEMSHLSSCLPNHFLGFRHDVTKYGHFVTVSDSYPISSTLVKFLQIQYIPQRWSNGTDQKVYSLHQIKLSRLWKFKVVLSVHMPGDEHTQLHIHRQTRSHRREEEKKVQSMCSRISLIWTHPFSMKWQIKWGNWINEGAVV